MDKNIANKDLRFICVCGFVCYTPGIEKEDLSFTREYGIRCLDGTSDAIESDEQGKLIQTAGKYAEAYNIILFKKLRSKQKTNQSVEPPLLRSVAHLSVE